MRCYSEASGLTKSTKILSSDTDAWHNWNISNTDFLQVVMVCSLLPWNENRCTKIVSHFIVYLLFLFYFLFLSRTTYYHSNYMQLCDNPVYSCCMIIIDDKLISTFFRYGGDVKINCLTKATELNFNQCFLTWVNVYWSG